MVPESLSQIRYEISSLHKDKEQKSRYDLDSQISEKITKILSIQFPEIYQRLEDSVPGGSGRGNSLFNSYLHFVNNHV
jgi:hypothetical protein